MGVGVPPPASRVSISAFAVGYGHMDRSRGCIPAPQAVSAARVAAAQACMRGRTPGGALRRTFAPCCRVDRDRSSPSVCETRPKDPLRSQPLCSPIGSRHPNRTARWPFFQYLPQPRTSRPFCVDVSAADHDRPWVLKTVVQLDTTDACRVLIGEYVEARVERNRNSLDKCRHADRRQDDCRCGPWHRLSWSTVLGSAARRLRPPHAAGVRGYRPSLRAMRLTPKH